jgi:sugar-specific transcriptional regulator TrmB
MNMDKGNNITTEIIYGIDNVVSTLLKVISNASHRLDVCVDSTRPMLLSDISQLRQAFFDAKSKGVCRTIYISRETQIRRHDDL